MYVDDVGVPTLHIRLWYNEKMVPFPEATLIVRFEPEALAIACEVYQFIYRLATHKTQKRGISAEHDWAIIVYR